MATVHIIGAGVSGLSAACALAEAHVPVKLYEASNVAGGRSRTSKHAGLGEIDTGLHLLRGYPTEAIRFLNRIGAREQLVEVPQPYRFLDSKAQREWSLSPRKSLPAASLADMAALAHLCIAPDTRTAADFLSETNPLYAEWAQNFARLRLNTPLDEVSARSFRREFLPSLLRSKLHMVKDSLRATFIDPALSFLEYCGGSVYFGHALSRLEESALAFPRKKITLSSHDVVILAVPPQAAAILLPGLPVPVSSHSAITLHFAADHGEQSGSIRFLTRGPVDLIRYDDGILRATLRVADNDWQADQNFLAQRVWKLLARLHPALHGTDLPEWTSWREKRAGHSLDVATATLPKLAREPKPRLLLAGDWLDPARPANLENAIASGHAAAARAHALIGERPLHTQTH